MYARTIKITFKDTMSKDMFVNFTDTKADSQGIKNGTLLKFIFENSDTSATLVLVFPDFKTFKKDHDNLAGPIIESLRKQELKIELNDGPIVGNTAVNSNFLNILKKEAAFYE
tara:strand:+ start:269 stop:607 length:339 start_codon:yes stop_codon:yes gene_type:complete